MNIYIGIEIKIRELYSRLLLAAEAAERGHSVVIGCKSETVDLARQGVLKPGIVYDKSITPSGKNILIFRELAERGHKLTAQDEEHGLFYESYDKFATQRFSKETLSLVTTYFCWGQYDERSLNSIFPSFSDKIVVSGSPRVDLWRAEFGSFHAYHPDEAALKFKKDHGKSVTSG